MTIHELSRLLANLIREATVVAYNAEGTVIVQSGGLVSQPLRFFQPSASAINTHRPLSVGENCLVFSPSGEFGNGYVLGGLPTGADQNEALTAGQIRKACFLSQSTTYTTLNALVAAGTVLKIENTEDNSKCYKLNTIKPNQVNNRESVQEKLDRTASCPLQIKLLVAKEVYEDKLRISKAHFYKMLKIEPDFPKSVKLSNRVLWAEHEVDQYIYDRWQASRNAV